MAGEWKGQGGGAALPPVRAPGSPSIFCPGWRLVENRETKLEGIPGPLSEGGTQVPVPAGQVAQELRGAV